jgi:fructokinase
VGELLWDLLPAGPRLGGAPLNVVAHLRRFGFDVAYVSAVGDDELGRQARAETSRLGIDDSFVGTVDVPTGIVRVQLDAAGVPDFEIVSPAAYEYGRLDVDPAALGPLDVLIYGTLSLRFPSMRDAAHRIAAANPAALRVYDVNLRPGCWSVELIAQLITDARIVKLNEAEAEILGRELDIPGGTLREFAEGAADRFGLEGVCITRGGDGAGMLMGGTWAEVPAVPVKIADTVGAGDAFCAGLIAGLTSGRPLDQVLAIASRLGGIVASRDGAIPDWNLTELPL